MTQIIGFAGSKQSGKNTACNFILAIKIAELGISKSTRLTDAGEIEVTDIFDDSISDQEWMPFKDPYVNVAHLFDNELGNFIRIYSFAEKLKRLCIEILGLKEELVFGNDKQKNTKTDIQWKTVYGSNNTDNTGYMTVREVLQVVGTDMFRGLDHNVWVNSCLRQIERESPEIALISDVRFENEVTAIQKNNNGFVIGLTRNPDKKNIDNHISEQEPQKCLKSCDVVIDNDNLSIPQQNKEIYLATEHLTNMTNVIGD